MYQALYSVFNYIIAFNFSNNSEIVTAGEMEY